tara:strand:+ start:1091 stop:1456 length:366 start_codon:yes stop_codon:yes gene_type:complete
MIERALDSNNDILIRNGSFATVEDGAQVNQHVRSRLQFYLGEWFLNTNTGTPWIQEIFVKPIDPRLVESVIRSKINNTPDLKMITEFSMSLPDRNTRQLRVNFSAETEFGTINSDGIFINV